MRNLRLKFVDFWPGFTPQDNPFWSELNKYFNLELSDNPEIIFFSVFGVEHLQYKCHKIFFTGENIRPNFKESDFALGFDYINNNKYLRYPLYTFYPYDLSKLSKEEKARSNYAAKTKFCCVVVSNPVCKFRNNFIEELSKYKLVDSGGKYKNNVGGPVADKLDFIKDYKFVISFENSQFQGYTTEKIVEPMIVGSVPIYWGSPDVGDEFNTDSFINVADEKSANDAIKAIIALDNDDDAYRRMQLASCLKNDTLQPFQDNTIIIHKLAQHIETILNNKPYVCTFAGSFYRHTHLSYLWIKRQLKKLYIYKIYAKYKYQ